MERLTNNIQMPTVEIERQQRQGREFLVVPVIAAVETVMNGALYIKDELAKSVQSFNGVPLTIGHPPVGKVANDPDIEKIGNIYNANIDGDKLKAQAWFDIELLQRLGVKGKQILDAISKKEVIEVSTGLFAEAVPQTGTFKNESYSMVMHDIMYDHLAILLNEVGACSIDDGCGLVRNEDEEVNNAVSLVEKVLTALGISHISKEIKPMADENEVQEPVTNNGNGEVLAAIKGLQESFDSKIQQLEQDLNGRIDEFVTNAEQSEKSPIVARLVANERCQLEENDLQAMSVCALNKLEASLKPVDYSGQGGSFYANVSAEESEFRYEEVE